MLADLNEEQWDDDHNKECCEIQFDFADDKKKGLQEQRVIHIDHRGNEWDVTDLLAAWIPRIRVARAHPHKILFKHSVEPCLEIILLKFGVSHKTITKGHWHARTGTRALARSPLDSDPQDAFQASS